MMTSKDMQLNELYRNERRAEAQRVREARTAATMDEPRLSVTRRLASSAGDLLIAAGERLKAPQQNEILAPVRRAG